jgi:general L-amino acid transport system substrate-binding protein
MKYEVVAFEKADEVIAAYDSGRCDVFTTDQSGLYAERLKLKNPDENVVLPEIISKEPLGPVVRQGDDAWFNVVKWTYFALLNAEETGRDRCQRRRHGRQLHQPGNPPPAGRRR